MPRIYRRTGQTFNCTQCGKTFYRSPSQIANGATATCSKDCMGEKAMGRNNPFWGRRHTDETRAKISIARKGKGVGNKHAAGYRHTEEARKRIAEASKHEWQNHREKRIAALPRGEEHHYHKPPELLRHRKQFTPRQRREWTATECFYCKSTEHLQLDHIIPIFDGGTTERANAQTLCKGCNLWKVKHVDLPRYWARLGRQGG